MKFEVMALLAAVSLFGCTTVQPMSGRGPTGPSVETTIQEVATMSDLDGQVVSVKAVVVTESFLAGKTGITGAMLYGALDNHVLVVRDDSISQTYAELVLTAPLFNRFLTLGVKKGMVFEIRNVQVKPMISGEKMIVPATGFALVLGEKSVTLDSVKSERSRKK